MQDPQPFGDIGSLDEEQQTAEQDILDPIDYRENAKPSDDHALRAETPPDDIDDDDDEDADDYMPDDEPE